MGCNMFWLKIRHCHKMQDLIMSQSKVERVIAPGTLIYFFTLFGAAGVTNATKCFS